MSSNPNNIGLAIAVDAVSPAMMESSPNSTPTTLTIESTHDGNDMHLPVNTFSNKKKNWILFQAGLAGFLVLYLAPFILYVLTSIGCALSNNITLLLVMRILQACSSSAASAVGAGPIIGGALNQYHGWHSIFWLLTALGGAALLVNIFTMPETLYPEMRQKTGRFNPLRSLLFFRYPAVTLSMLYPGLVFGFSYLLITILPRTYITQYSFNTTQVGLTFLASGFGNVVGTIISGRYLDRILLTERTKLQKKPPAEVRLRALWPSVILAPLGFLMYGWFIERSLYWFVPLIGSFIMSVGMMMGNTVINVYLIDAFTAHSASVVSLANFVRAVIASITPLFAVQMVDGLGNGWTFTIVGAIILLGAILPFLVYLYGIRWRPEN
ncbi:major facilitator superfamily domain-containing protein [Syncephalis plumigaleata]|nr:major facilitator superfamily domain-containing protein [Syncephalis plumigaleata]